MANSIVHDSVSLQHFSTIQKLDVLQERHESLDEPRWTLAVKTEIEVGSLLGHSHCQNILDLSWLGAPFELEGEDLFEVQQLQIALSGFKDGNRDRGEAHSIVVAKRFGASFFTDDSDAYLVASQNAYLGSTKVLDTIDFLRNSVAAGAITAEAALEIVNEIFASGRRLRRSHKKEFSMSDFTESAN